MKLPSELEKFKVPRNKTRRDVRFAKKYYLNAKFHSITGDSKLIYKTLNQLTNKSSSGTWSPCLQIGDLMVDNIDEIVNIFNNFFANVGPELAAKVPFEEKNFTVSDYEHSMFLFNTDEKEVVNTMNTISDLKTKNSSAFDNISKSFIKKTRIIWYHIWFILSTDHLSKVAFQIT